MQFGIKDEEFIRGKVPMTKAEIRAMVMVKAAIQPGDIVADIGAGLLRSCQRTMAGSAVAVFPWPCAGREGYVLYARTKARLSDGS